MDETLELELCRNPLESIVDLEDCPDGPIELGRFFNQEEQSYLEFDMRLMTEPGML